MTDVKLPHRCIARRVSRTVLPAPGDLVNVDDADVHRLEDFTFLNGIFDLGRAAHEAALRLVMATRAAVKIFAVLLAKARQRTFVTPGAA